MNIEQVVREVQVRGSVQGMDQVARAYDQVATSADRAATVTEKTSKAQASAEAAIEKLRQRYQDGYRQQQQYTDAMAAYQRAVDQGRISQQAAAAELANIQNKLGQATSGQKAASTVTQAFNLQIAALAGNLGITGQVLSAFGPVGFAAAVGLGAAVAVLNSMSDQAHALADKAKELREFSEATGLTTTQFQALRSEAGKFGIDSETLSTGLSRFTAQFQELRNGQGELLTSIRKVNPALADEMQRTTDAATAFTLFGKAVAQTDDVFQRNSLLKAGLGKGSSIFGAFFAAAPDVAALTQAFQAAGKGLDENLIQKLATLNTDIARTKAAANNVFAPLFAEQVLTSELQFSNVLLDMAKTLRLIAETIKQVTFPDAPDWVKKAIALAGKSLLTSIPIIGPAIAIAQGARAAVGAGASAYNNQQAARYPDGGDPMAASSYGGGAASAPAAAASKTVAALAADWKNYISVLGSAATPTEKLNADIADLTAKAETAGRSTADLDRGIAALRATAAATDLKNLVAILGSAATPAEKLKASIADLTVRAAEAGQSSEVLGRGIAGLKLDAATAQQQAHNSALGGAATVTDAYNAKVGELQKLQQQGAGLTQAQIDKQLALTVAQSSGIANINALTDSENVRREAIGKGTEASLAYSTAQAEINKQLQQGRSLQDINVEGIKAAAAEYAKTKVSTDQYADSIDLAKSSAREFTTDLVKGLMSGKTGMEALAQAATNLSQKLADKAIMDLLSGDPLTMAKGAVEGIASAISYVVGKDAAKAAELEKAKKAWEGMGDQVVAFNHAAAGFNLGALTQALQQLAQTELELAKAAYNAHDSAGLARVQNTFNQGVIRLITEFSRGSETLTPYAQALKDLNDEAQGLIETLNSENLQGAAGVVAAALPGRVAALTKQYTDQLVTDLTTRLNAANGQDYLNSAAALIAQRDADAAAAQQLGVSMDLVNKTFAAGAQKIVTDANLTGGAFDDFIAKFPQLAGVVQQATAVIARSADEIAQTKQTYDDQLFALQQDQTTLAGQLAVFDRQAAEARLAEQAKGGEALNSLVALQAAQRLDIEKKYDDQRQAAQLQAAQQFQTFVSNLANTIKNFLHNLDAGSGTLQSPLQRLNSALSIYQATLTSAQGGNQDAANQVTSDASNLIEAEKAYYGSAQQTQDALAQIKSDLNALPAQISSTQQVVNAISAQTTALQAAFAAGDASAIATALLPQFSQLTANTNGLLSFTQFQSIAGGLASQATLQNMFSTLDTNGDGQLSKLELINASTAATKSLTDSIKDSSATTASNIPGLIAIQTTTSNTASAVQQSNGFLTTIANNTGLLTSIASNTSSTANTLGSILASYSSNGGDQLNRIRANLNAQNVKQSISAFRDGGIIGGVGTGTSDSNLIWASVGEGILNAAATSALGGAGAIRNLNAGRVPLLPVPVASAANGDAIAELVAEVRALRGEVAELKAEMTATKRNTAATAEGVKQSAAAMVASNAIEADRNKLIGRKAIGR